MADLTQVQKDLVNERLVLNTKIINLKAFIERNPIFTTLPVDEQNDMIEQLRGMEITNNALKRRVERINTY